MRAPSRSFRTSLVTYRQQLVADNEQNPQLPLWLEVLDNWAKHKSAEAIWQTIKERTPPEIMLTEEELIWLVLERRHVHLEPLNHLVDTLPKVKSKIDQRTKHHLKAGKHIELAHENGLLGYVRERSNQLLGREKKAAIRNQFVLSWTSRFMNNCGQPLDEVVRDLTEIAFGKAITIDAVRGARKGHSLR